MRKKILCALLCLGLCLGSVQAAENGFADVAESDWFSPYVAVCAEKGLMEGTGEGRFSPGRTLTTQECTVLALRLYDIQRGGDGTFPAPPSDWGQMTLTAGEYVQTDHIRNFRTLPQWWEEGAGPWNAPTLWLDDKELAARMDGMEAVVAYAGVEYAGRLQRRDEPDWSSACLVFRPDDPAAFRYVSDSYEFLPGEWENGWPKNAWYYGDVHGLRDTPLFSRGLSRLAFARAMAYAAGELESINTIPSLPDLDREGNGDIYGLYEAGILTGVDESGAFAGDKTLTRSEAAAMLARVLEPSLRLDFTPAQPERRDYTLTPVELPEGWVPTADSNKVAAGWAAIQRVENDTVAEEAICRADGAVLGLDGYFVYGFEHLTSRGSATRLLVQTYGAEILDYEAARGSLWNIYDVEQERFLLEKGMSDNDPAWEEAQETYLPSALSTWPQPRLDKDSGLYGYVDREGNQVIPPQYDMAGPFADGAAVVHFRDGETPAAAIDKTGKELLPRRYSELWYLGEGVFNYWGDLSSWEDDDWRGDCGIVTMEGVEMPSATFSGYFNGGLAAHHGLIAMGHEDGNNWVMAYYDFSGNQVTEDLDWAGPIGPDGAGFVCKGGRLFRIQF